MIVSATFWVQDGKRAPMIHKKTQKQFLEKWLVVSQKHYCETVVTVSVIVTVKRESRGTFGLREELQTKDRTEM